MTVAKLALFLARGNVVFLPVNSPLPCLSLIVFLGDAGCSGSMYTICSDVDMLVYVLAHTPLQKEGSSDEGCGGRMYPMFISAVTLMCIFSCLHTHQYKKEIAAMKAAAEADMEQLQHNATLIRSLQVNMHAPRKDFSGREEDLSSSLGEANVLLSRVSFQYACTAEEKRTCLVGYMRVALMCTVINVALIT